jgi:hypothetical protein
MTELKAAAQRKLSLGQTLRAVAWSFFGVRKAQDQDQDVRQLNPIYVIIAGILAGMVFVLTLVLLVQWVLASGVAT